MRLRFPLRILAFEMMLHYAPRVLLGPYGSRRRILQPRSSLQAGVRGAVFIDRCVLYAALEAARSRFDPRGIETRSWVDDINQRAEGPFRVRRHALVAADTFFGRLLRADGHLL